MSATTLVGVITPAMEYVRAVRSAIPDRAVAVAHEQAQQCILHIRSMKLDHADATHALRVLQDSSCVFTTEQVTQLSDAIVSAMHPGSAPVQSTGHSKSQSNNYVHLYLNDDMWMVLESRESVEHKMEHLCRYFIEALYMRFPSETVRRDAVAIMLAAMKVDVDSHLAHQYVERFRDLMDIFRGCTPGPMGPRDYPSNPRDFMTLYPEAFKNRSEPVCSRVDCATLERIKRATPARKTHKALASTHSNRIRGKTNQPASSTTIDPMSALSDFVMGHMSQRAFRAAPAYDALFRRQSGVLSITDGHPEGSPQRSPARSLSGSPEAVRSSASVDGGAVVADGGSDDALRGNLDELRRLSNAKFDKHRAAFLPPKDDVADASGTAAAAGEGEEAPIVAVVPTKSAPAPLPGILKRPHGVLKKPAGVIKRPASAGGDWTIETRYCSDGRTYKVIFGPGGECFPSFLKARRAGMPM